MTSAWDQNQTTLRRVITDHITKVMGGRGGGRPQSVFGMQFEDKGIEMEKATESTESPEKGALGSSSGKKIIF